MSNADSREQDPVIPGAADSLHRHLAVGMWHGFLCQLGEGKEWAPYAPSTYARERVTCPRCLILLDALDERGWPVTTRLQWWEGYTTRDGRWSEGIWPRTKTPSPARKRQAQRLDRSLTRVRVIDPKSLKYHAASLTGAKP